jgi:hypothetical protein
MQKEYLTQFLGASKETRSLADDICEYRRGGAPSKPTATAINSTGGGKKEKHSSDAKGGKGQGGTTRATAISSSISSNGTVSDGVKNNKSLATTSAHTGSTLVSASSIKFMSHDTVPVPVPVPSLHASSMPIVPVEEREKGGNMTIITKSKPKRGRKDADLINIEYLTEPTESKCSCQAAVHKLYTNCTSCGYIMCDLDTRNTFCTFCKSPIDKMHLPALGKASKGEVAASQAADAIDGGANVDDNINNDRQLKAAIDRKNRLLAFDKNEVQAGRVFDDQADYYNANDLWLSPEDRAKAFEKEAERKRKLHSRERANRIQFDFAGRRIVVVDDDDDSGDGGGALKEVEIIEGYSIPTPLIGDDEGGEVGQAKREGSREASSGVYANNQLKGKSYEMYEAMKAKLAAARSSKK